MVRENGYYWVKRVASQALEIAYYDSKKEWWIYNLSNCSDNYFSMIGDRIEEPKESRKEGFYWVKYQGYWEIAEWKNEEWFCTGIEEPFEDSDFEEIGENRIERKS